MKIEDVTIEWGIDAHHPGQYFFSFSLGQSIRLSGHGPTLDEARAYALRELPVALEGWAEYASARRAFMAGSGFEPGDAPEAFERWWAER